MKQYLYIALPIAALLFSAGCVTPTYTYVEPPPPPVVAPVTYSSGSSYVVPSYGPTWSTYEYRSYVPPIPPPGVHGHHHHYPHHHLGHGGHHHSNPPPPPRTLTIGSGKHKSHSSAGGPPKTSKPPRTFTPSRPVGKPGVTAPKGPRPGGYSPAKSGGKGGKGGKR